MAFVIDASIAGSWWLPDEALAETHILLRRLGGETAVAPSVWWFEVRNLLLMAERRDRIDAAGSAALMADLEELSVEIDGNPSSGALLALARSHRLSAYDAAYLELAARRGLPLATLDQALAAAARAEGVAVLPA